MPTSSRRTGRAATPRGAALRRGALVGTLALGLLSLAWPGAVAAHRPLEAGGNLTSIPDLDTSYAFYRDLAEGEVQRYAIDASAGSRLDVGVSIPAIERYATYEVAMALVGPGLPRDGAPPDAAAVDLAGDDGWIVAAHEDRGTFFEPFTQTDYRQGQRIVLDLPADGSYALLVWQPAGTAGKYVLDSGRAEVFTPADVLRFPGWWVSVNAYFGHWWRIGLVGLLVAAVALLAARTVVRRVAGSASPRSRSQQVSEAADPQLRSR